jgi:ribonuclease Z
MIDFLVLGTGAMEPLPDRWLSSMLVRCRGELTLFDCGEGTQIPWREYGWGFRRLGAICLSHCHADHVAGLPGLLHSIANARRTEPVALYGPPGAAQVVAGLRVIAPMLPYRLDVHEVKGGDRIALPGGLSGSILTVEHRVPCVAYRVSIHRARRFLPDRARALGVPIDRWGALQGGEPVNWDGKTVAPNEVLGPPRPGLSFGFVTDTRPTPAMPQFFSGVNLLVCEGTYGDNDDLWKAEQNKHMTYAEAATLALTAGAKSLLLTHFSPSISDPRAWLANATAIFPATTIAESGMTLTLSFSDENEDASPVMGEAAVHAPGVAEG